MEEKVIASFMFNQQSYREFFLHLCELISVYIFLINVHKQKGVAFLLSGTIYNFIRNIMGQQPNLISLTHKRNYLAK